MDSFKAPVNGIENFVFVALARCCDLPIGVVAAFPGSCLDGSFLPILETDEVAPGQPPCSTLYPPICMLSLLFALATLLKALQLQLLLLVTSCRLLVVFSQWCCGLRAEKEEEE